MSAETKELMKISSATFGVGGYQDAMFGLSLSFSSPGSGVGTFVGGWGIERSERAKWSEADRMASIYEAAWLLKETLEKAKKRHVAELAGTPVEVTFENGVMKSWRVLEEVL